MRMASTRHARSVGLASAAKVKRPGTRFYRGGSDSNKGQRKRTWYEVACYHCDRRIAITPPSRNPRCPKCGSSTRREE